MVIAVGFHAKAARKYDLNRIILMEHILLNVFTSITLRDVNEFVRYVMIKNYLPSEFLNT